MLGQDKEKWAVISPKYLHLVVTPGGGGVQRVHYKYYCILYLLIFLFYHLLTGVIYGTIIRPPPPSLSLADHLSGPEPPLIGQTRDHVGVVTGVHRHLTRSDSSIVWGEQPDLEAVVKIITRST